MNSDWPNIKVRKDGVWPQIWYAHTFVNGRGYYIGDLASGFGVTRKASIRKCIRKAKRLLKNQPSQFVYSGDPS